MDDKKIKEIIGKTYGRWVVESYAYTDSKARRFYNCVCTCGTKRVVQYSALNLGNSVSCGCFMKEKNGNRNRTHGKYKNPIYFVYNRIKGRCYNPKSKAYKDYGARGIKMCDEWRNDFMAFYNWAIANGFSDKKTKNGRMYYSIDRIDVNGDYEPSNCRWADDYIQNNNKRNNVRFEYNGTVYSIKELCKISGLNENTLYYRLNHWDIKDALTRELGNNCKEKLNYGTEK